MTIGVNQTVSPLKFCFLIEPNSENKFERAVKIAFSYWGGIFSPILPLHLVLPNEFISEYKIEYDALNYYKNTIDNFDPDIILYDNSLDVEYIKTLIGDRVLLTIEDFLSNTEKGEIKYGISIPELISHIIETEFKFVRNDNLKLSLPNTQNSGLFLKSFIGCFVDSFQKEISDQLQSYPYFEQPEISFDNAAEHLPSENISTIDINIKKIKAFPVRHKGEGIYFLNDTRLNDIINYWNLRSLGWTIIPIPLSQIDNVYFSGLIERFIYFCQKKSENLTLINFLISTSTTLKQKQKLEQKFQEVKNKIEGNLEFSFQGWFPRFWSGERSILEADKVLCGKTSINTIYSQVEVEENRVKFEINNLPFKLEYNYNLKASHKVNLTFSFFDEYLNDAGLIYGIETIDWIRLTHSFGRDKWRLSKTGLSYYVRREDDEVYFFIPKAKDFFRIYFSKSGNKLNQTPNGRLANEVLKNIGGIRGSYFLQNKSSLDILGLIEDGKTVYHSKLIGEIKKSLNISNKDKDKIYSYIKKIIENKIIEFGSILQCEVCHQHSFYLPSELKETMTCAICRNNFGLPMHQPTEIKWAYRGIGPFSKNNKVGGVITVFLTLKLFNQEFADTSSNMSALIGFELVKNKKTKEVDLAVMLQEKHKDNIPPDLIFCECKTYKNFTSDDADRMVELGTEFPNSILTFATLNEDLSENERTEILRVVNHFRTGVGHRPTNPVLILTAKELLPNDFWGHFSEYEKDSKPYHRYNDWIGNLCEFSVKKHLGVKTWGEIQSELWIEEMQKRNEAIQTTETLE